MLTLAQDVRLALRLLRKQPVFTVVAVLMLAVGIGANATIFSWVNAVLLNPLPGALRPDALVQPVMIFRGTAFTSFSYPDYRDLRDTTRTLSAVKIATFNGNMRRGRFDLQVATVSGAWSNVLTSAETSGTTTAEETFDVADVPARWVRYVGHGNTDPAKSTWNSVTELSLWGR